MKRSMNGPVCAFYAGCCSLLLTAARASAQDATVGVGASTAVRPAAAPAAVVNTGSDHNICGSATSASGGWGPLYFTVGPATAANPGLTVPTVGIRYWAAPRSLESISGWGCSCPAALPPRRTPRGCLRPSMTPIERRSCCMAAYLSLSAESNHFNVQITPELDVGFGSGTIHAMPTNTDLSGFLLQVGGRAGAEVYFGFIGIPQLSLDASVGSFCSPPAERAPRPRPRTSTRRSSSLLRTSILLGISFARTSRHATISEH